MSSGSLKFSDGDEVKENIDKITDTVVTKKGNRTGRGAPKQHIPGEDGLPICDITERYEDSIFNTKDLSVYPPAWRDICNNCAEKYAKGEVEPWNKK